MLLITFLQKEMANEQTRFNSLSSAIQDLKDHNSYQHMTISYNMKESQSRLSMLMRHSVKCISKVCYWMSLVLLLSMLICMYIWVLQCE